MQNLLDESALRDLSILPILVNLVLVLALGQLLCLHYLRYSGALSNKRKFAPILLFIAATTMLVISVVKTSLALSLGLVGALSIIRFRTPIKEPEELAYLFLSVALGIGLGADQRLATSIMFLVILGAIAVKRHRAAESTVARALLHLNADLGRLGEGDRSTRSAIDRLLQVLNGKADTVDLRRVDAREDVLDASVVLEIPDSGQIGALVAGVQEAFPGATVTLVESGAVD